MKSRIKAFAVEFVSNPNYKPRLPKDAKIIHDALWGTIRLEPWEIALLDLPLFQRLRQIGQTSLVRYVFPGCNHTRFEHTLGTLHQTQKLAEAVNTQFPGRNAPFDSDTLRNLRLAALFHDCGHSCFSYISENLYQDFPDISSATAESGPYPGGHAHEVLSAMILLSKPVRQYVAEIAEHYEVELDPDQAAKWIVGQTDQEQYRYRTQVINGPFDADKLDYIFRDAHYSGLPVALDLYRLWATCKPESVGDSRILTLHQSGAQPLEQILFNKFNLFSIVYQHPKVRAGECMFQGVVEYAKENGLKLAGQSLDSGSDFRLFAVLCG